MKRICAALAFVGLRISFYIFLFEDAPQTAYAYRSAIKYSIINKENKIEKKNRN
jgi:hypothetical protein